MRALPLWPEWAYMAVRGFKAMETRSRPIRTIVGERVVIHATLKGPEPVGWTCQPVARGALVGTVRVLDCVQMTPEYLRMMEGHPRERMLGDYRVGRWAFALTEPRAFVVPVPWKGSQGVFMVPDEVVRVAEHTFELAS